MMNSKVKSIIKHNVDTSIRNKWFVILNVLMLLVVIVSFNIDNISTLLKNKNIDIGSKDKLVISIDDETDTLKNILDNKIIKYKLEESIETKVDTNDGDYTNDTIPDSFINIILNLSEDEVVKAKVISKEAIKAKYLDIINEAILDVRNNIISDKFNISNENMELIKKTPYIERIMLSVDESNQNEPLQIARMVINYIVFFILIMVLSATANSVAQEKTSKSIEYVLTSISAKDYLLSKVLSTILVYVIQFVFSIVYMLIGMYIGTIIKLSTIANQGINLDSNSIGTLSSIIDGKLILYVGVTFIFSLLTIFVLNIIQAVLSSKTTNITEAGNTTIILLMLNLCLYLLSNFIIDPLKVPSIFMYIASCIPIVSMYFIPSMIAIGQATTFQLVIATILLVISVPLVLKIGAKFFKQGVLSMSTLKKNFKKGAKGNISDEELREKKLKGREYSKAGYVIGLSIILYIVITNLLTIISSFISLPLYDMFGGKISQTNISTILTCIVFCITLYIPYYFLKSYTNNNEEKEVNNKKASISKSFVYVLMGIPLVTFIQILTSFILSKINVDYNIVDKLNIFNGESSFSMILFFIQIAVLPAIFEELYMRKGVINYLKKYGSMFAILTSSIMFAGIHLNLSQSIFAFMLGTVFAIIAIKTNRIFPTMLLHFINNGLSALVLIFKDNLIVVGVIGFIYILLNLTGIIMIILAIVFKYKNKKKSQNNEKISNKKRSENILQIYKYMLTDYTFIISVILIVILSIYTEKMLNIM